MSMEFFPKLSQNYIELLKDDEYYDVTIEVGEDPNVKIFRAHMSILCYRSPYLRRTLASADKKNDGGSLFHIKLPNISPENFQIILKYIYGGILSLNEQETSDILNVLVAASILCLQELVDYLQKYLIHNKFKWIEENFESTLRISSQSNNNLLELQQFCTNLIAKSPEKIFQSFDFNLLSEKILISLIKRIDLKMKEIEIWDYLLKWGISKNSNLILLDPNTWSDDDFKMMKNTLKNCLPLIRFFSLSSKEFLQKVRPYKKLLNHQLYENLLNSHLDPDIKPMDNNNNNNNNILLPRNNIDIKIEEILDSKIITSLNIISTTSRWIDKLDVNNNFSHIRELYLPYKFQLLLRGSRDGFSPKKFHELCDNKPKTITFIKVKEKEEILGGYNPIIWESSKTWGETKDSFIFSFKNKDNKINNKNNKNNNNDFNNDTIINNVEDTNHALVNHPECGPNFGHDIIIQASAGEYSNYDTIYCKKDCYEKRIRDTEDQFSIEDYEVFQIKTKKRKLQ